MVFQSSFSNQIESLYPLQQTLFYQPQETYNNKIVKLARTTIQSSRQTPINERLTKNDPQLQFLQSLNLDSYNAANLTAFWHNLAKYNNEWNISFDDPRLKSIKEHTYKILDQSIRAYIKIKKDSLNGSTEIFFNCKELATIVWAFTKLGFTDNTIINSLMLILKLTIKNADLLTSHQLVRITWALVMLNKASTYPELLRDLLINIEIRFKNNEDFYAEIYNQLLQIREILPIEASTIQIPWDKPLHDTLDTYQQSREPPESSILDNNVYESLDRIHKSNENFTAYELSKEHYALGYFIDNVLISDNKKIAIEVCGPCHYFTGTENPLPELEIKKRILQKDGWTVIIVPYFDWTHLNEGFEKDDYVTTKIQEIIQPTITMSETKPLPKSITLKRKPLEPITSILQTSSLCHTSPNTDERQIWASQKENIPTVQQINSTVTNFQKRPNLVVKTVKQPLASHTIVLKPKTQTLPSTIMPSTATTPVNPSLKHLVVLKPRTSKPPLVSPVVNHTTLAHGFERGSKKL